MRLKWGHVARYAEHSPVGTTIIGVFDYIHAPTIAPDAPVPLPLFYLVCLIGCTSFEAGKHLILVRLVDEDGVEGGRFEFKDAVFEAPMPGVELGGYLVHPVFGLAVPHYGDYIFEVWGGNQRLGAIDFSVREPVVPVVA